MNFQSYPQVSKKARHSHSHVDQSSTWGCGLMGQLKAKGAGSLGPHFQPLKQNSLQHWRQIWVAQQSLQSPCSLVEAAGNRKTITEKNV